MNCNEVRELIPDLAAGFTESTPEIDQHVRDCAECRAKLAGIRQTMALLDEWQTPEPSPYFDVRLKARLREDIGRHRVSFLQWFRKPALAVAFAVLMVASVTIMRVRDPGPPPAPPEPGTAVGDLQALDKNEDLYADFDVLDDLQVQPDVSANP
jgi:predicted anti-sigma-YlaC factor YlaD